MNDTAKLGVAVAGGYLLGRTRKMKMALGLGLWLAGRKMKTRPTWLIADAVQQLAASPEVGKLREQFSGELLSAGKRAAGTAIEGGVGRLADTLADRTAALSEAGEGVKKAGGGAAKAGKNAGGKATKQVTGPAKDRAGRGRAEADDEYDETDEYDEVDEADEADEEGPEEESDEVYPEEQRGRRERPRAGSGGRGGSSRSGAGRPRAGTSRR